MTIPDQAHHDRVKYADCMTFVRYRLQVIDAFAARRITTGYFIPDLESTCLQFRLIFELIAMSSLCANKEHCQEVRRRFDKMWNAAEIVRFVEQINPNFYPVPLRRQVNADGSGGVVSHMLDGFLTKDELIEAHGRCGELLHASNPYAPGDVNEQEWQRRFQTWRKRLANLLESHKAHLVESEREWWVLLRFGTNLPVQVAVMRKVANGGSLKKLLPSS